MTDIAIQVENLSKRYRIGVAESQPESLTQALSEWVKAPLRNFHNIYGRTHFGANGHEPDDIIWALKDVSFEVKHGEVLGIVGRNGAGKSTLLKILSRITEPTSGRVVINGRVSSLLEVGTGFHPELTGRENVYLNGTILGMRKVEVDCKFDEIVDFAGVERFIDTPVKYYSSGMKVRLAFAVAAHLEPEILIIDEVLAVGDAEFQQKCLGKMEGVSQSGRTVLFVSHKMSAVHQLCPRAILIAGGTLVHDDFTENVISQYLNNLYQQSTIPLSGRTDRRGDGPERIQRIEVNGVDTVEAMPVLRVGQPARFEIYVNQPCAPLNATLAFWSMEGERMLGCDSRLASPDDSKNAEPTDRIVCEIPELPFTPGKYRINVRIFTQHGRADGIEAAVIFIVEGGIFQGQAISGAMRSSVLIPHRWSTPERSEEYVGVNDTDAYYGQAQYA